MYKVFFNDSFLVLANPNYFSESVHTFNLQSFNQLEKWVHEAEIASFPIHLICHTDNIEETWQKFCSLFKIIEAAGGLVSKADEKYLCIFRRGSWDLPKGKIDKGETPEEAAIREVHEETGLEQLSIDNHILDTYHLYRLKGVLVLKKTYWYKMINHGTSKLIPQKEEDIEKALWLKAKEIKPLTKNMFGSVKDVLNEAEVLM